MSDIHEDACADIRTILIDAGIPPTAFIDDHVRVLVRQRDDLVAALEAILDRYDEEYDAVATSEVVRDELIVAARFALLKAKGEDK